MEMSTSLETISWAVMQQISVNEVMALMSSPQTY
jgi:hypothetical protein